MSYLSFADFRFSGRVLLPVVLGVLLPVSGGAHTIGSNFDCAKYGVTIGGPKSLRGELTTVERVMRVASLLPVIKGEDGSTIYPVGTTIDRADIVDGILNVWITFPTGIELNSLDQGQVYQGGEVLRHYFADSEGLVGNRIHARRAGDTDYQSLEAFIYYETPGAMTARDGEARLDYEIDGPGPQPDPDYDVLYAAARTAEESERTSRNVSGQSPLSGSGLPTGALAGRIIYTYGGHGRTWDGEFSNWRWQRGYTYNMMEDFGNADASDAYAYYCFNAGATVVSFRPIGYQDNEVVMDNTSAGVTRTGVWNNSTNSRYFGSGTPNYLWTTTKNADSATVTYTPNIPEAGYYPVYTWVNYGSDRVALGQLYRIKTTGGEAQVRVDHRRVGCGWVYLGSYYFDAGSNTGTGSVTISNLNPPGITDEANSIVVADGIRFGNGMGDTSNGGGISGWSRREESTVYWIQNGWGNGSSVWTAGQVWNNSNTSDDENLSWSAPPRMAAEMTRLHSGDSNLQQALYLGWHSNASDDTSARGSMGLITTANTPNQAWWAARVSDQLDLASDEEESNWEYVWNNRSSATYKSAYGEITSNSLLNRMDATIIEVAFHSSPADAALMRDPKVRMIHGRGAYRAAVQYFNNFRGGTLAYLPESPVRFRAANNGMGGVALNWQPGPTGGTKGQAATSYRLYQSPDGLGWGAGVTVAGTGHTINGLTAGQTYYFKVAGVNAGGESFPTETLAVRVTMAGTAQVLVVNGYDRMDRFNNIPRGGMPSTVEQLIHRQNNAYDYVRQHASAIAAAGQNLDSTSNEAVISGDINLTNYQVVVWILGEESTRDNTFDATERTKVDQFLAAGKSLFVSGAETSYQLDSLNVGRTFYRNSLRSQYLSDSAGTYQTDGSPGSIFAGISGIDFAPTNVIYNVDSPDVITPVNGSTAAMAYRPASPITDAFDTLGTWQAPSYSGTTTADSSTFNIVTSPKRQGSGSGDLGYNWTLGTVLREYNSGGFNMPNTSTFSIWVYGDNSGHTLRLFMRDSVDGELFQNTATVINFSGWRQIVWNLATDPKTKFAGTGDGLMTGAVRLDSLYLTKTGSSNSGHLYFDEASYSGGSSSSPGTAAVQYSGSYKLVNLAFPFEAIGSETQRNQVMQNAMTFLMTAEAGVGDWSMY